MGAGSRVMAAVVACSEDVVWTALEWSPLCMLHATGLLSDSLHTGAAAVAVVAVVVDIERSILIDPHTAKQNDVRAVACMRALRYWVNRGLGA